MSGFEFQRTLPDERRAGELVADRIGKLLEVAPRRGERVAIGCPAGRTPRSTYAALGRIARERELDLSRLDVVLMDEYVEEVPGGYVYCPGDAPYSCRHFAERELRAVLNAGLPAPRQLRADRIHVPKPDDPASYEDEIAALGGIDLFVLAAGASDGHVAFNPPGSTLASTTRIVALAESTRRDNLHTFPTFRSLDEVPRFGVTVGLGTILRHSKAVVLLLLGEQKRAALARTLALHAFDPAWPASVIRACAGAQIVADMAAAGAPATCPSPGIRSA